MNMPACTSTKEEGVQGFRCLFLNSHWGIRDIGKRGLNGKETAAPDNTSVDVGSERKRW